MTPAETINLGLSLLGEDLGVSLALDEANCCGLDLDDGVQCTVELGVTDDSLFIYGPLVPVTAGGAEPLLRRALALNLYGLKTGGAGIAFDSDAGTLVLCHRLPAALLEPGQVADLIGDFLLRLQALRAELAAEPQPSADTGDRDDPLAGLRPGQFA